MAESFFGHSVWTGLAAGTPVTAMWLRSTRDRRAGAGHGLAGLWGYGRVCFFAARATARLAMRLFAPNLRTYRAGAGLPNSCRGPPRCGPRACGPWRRGAVAGLAATMVATVAVIVQHILNALERGFAAFFAGAAFALAFAAALTGPAFSSPPWSPTSLRTSSHFLQFLGLFFSEDGSHFLCILRGERRISHEPLAIFAFPGFSHQFAKGGTLIFLQLFHLQSLFFVEPESLGHGGTAIGVRRLAAGFGRPFPGPRPFRLPESGGQQAGR